MEESQRRCPHGHRGHCEECGGWLKTFVLLALMAAFSLAFSVAFDDSAPLQLDASTAEGG
jgi:hypothetical protein